MSNTGMGAGRTVAAALLALAMFSSSAAAEPSALRAKVIWANAGRVYIASADSLALEVGDLLAFQADRKTIALATVSAIHDGTLAIARLESGTLERVKKLDRLRVFSERRPMRPLPVLRVGLPARSNLLFACEAATLRAPFSTTANPGDTSSEGPYRIVRDASSDRLYRFVRDTSSAETAPWPDTLVVRLFGDATDEEIALEREELDAAVFWPGELSTRMREDARWRDFPHGTRSRGCVVVQGRRGGPMGFTSADSSAILSLNEEVFRGDLTPWDPERGAPLNLVVTEQRRDSRPFEVDRYCPGWQVIEGYLNRGKGPLPASGEPSALRVRYIDAQPVAPDGGGLVFAIRCPIVCAPNLCSYVRALDASALVDMLGCRR